MVLRIFRNRKTKRIRMCKRPRISAVVVVKLFCEEKTILKPKVRNKSTRHLQHDGPGQPQRCRLQRLGEASPDIGQSEKNLGTSGIGGKKSYRTLGIIIDTVSLLNRFLSGTSMSTQCFHLCQFDAHLPYTKRNVRKNSLGPLIFNS